MKMFAVTAFALVFLCGCMRVQSNVTVFSALPAKASGETVAIYPVDKSKLDTLEFKSYAAKVGAYLQKAGYTLIDYSPETPPHYLAMFGYGIDDGTMVTETTNVPRFGVVGYSGATTSGTLIGTGTMATLNATTTYEPQYGVTGYTPETSTARVYKRAVLLDIYDVTQFKPGENAPARAQVYDSKLTSEGSCGAIANIIDPLLASLFQDFPTGTSRKIVMPTGAKC